MSELIQIDRMGCLTLTKLGASVTLTPEEVTALLDELTQRIEPWTEARHYAVSLAGLRQLADLIGRIEQVANLLPPTHALRNDVRAESIRANGLLCELLGEDRHLVFADDGGTAWAKMKGAIA